MNPDCHTCAQPDAIGVLTIIDTYGHQANWWTCPSCADLAATHFAPRGYTLHLSGPMEACWPDT
jgi:hypothetical protein